MGYYDDLYYETEAQQVSREYYEARRNARIRYYRNLDEFDKTPFDYDKMIEEQKKENEE